MHRNAVRGLVVAGVAVGLFVSASGVLAGSGIGGVFNLGKGNAVNAVTSLTGSTSTRLLQVTNNGTGVALRLTVKAGAAPMQVNTSVKVANLNADQVDGSSVLRARLAEPLNSGNANVLAIPGLATVEASCGAGGVPSYRLFFRNGLSGQPADVWFSDSTTSVTYAGLASGGGVYVAPVDTATDRVVTVTDGLANGSLITVTISAHASASGCVFYAVAVGG